MFPTVRSARHNRLEGGVWNSEHMFGDAVDIRSITVDGPHMRSLWLAAECPKILERMVDGTYEVMLEGRCNNTGLSDWNGALIEGVFVSNFDTLAKGRRDADDNKVYDILEDLNGNGVADIFDDARVIHLGD